MEAELKQSQKDRSSIKTAMSEATASREKQAAAFAAENADSNANIAVINAAVAALEKGMAGGFLQTNAAQSLKKLVLSKESMYENGREKELALCCHFND